MNTISHMVRRLIDHYRMTQQEIADAIGVTQPLISYIYTRGQATLKYEPGKKLEALYEAREKLQVDAEQEAQS